MYRFCLIFLVSSLFASEPIFICIAGASGSGKTTVAERVAAPFGDDVVIISQDSYYKKQDHLRHEERAQTNFDHPDSLEFSLLAKHLQELKKGKAIDCPIYDFVLHTRSDETTHIEPKKVIIVEGILLLAMPELRDLFDVKIYIDTDKDVCFIRRVKRDMAERGRTFKSVEEQYLTTVRPMFEQFVEPSKRYADVIIPWGRENIAAIDVVVCKLRQHLAD